MWIRQINNNKKVFGISVHVAQLSQLYLWFSLPLHGLVFPAKILAFVVIDFSVLLFFATFIPLKRRFGKDEQNLQKMKMKSQSIFCSSFQHLRLGSIKLRNFVFAIPGGESDAAWRTKNGAISHPRLNEGTCIREYSKVRLILTHLFKSFQCPFELDLTLSTHVCKSLR